ncbi:hypothetical protein C8R48DRAFT_678368 [Suillus tomentosus]|nr:hypothetical protein C8R48DRAFT_678368 [Suillus tomentosus]
MSTRRVTRTKNATQRPGLVDAVPKKKRRTAAEVAAERQAKLDAKEEKERAKGAGIKRVAEYEKKQAEKDASTDATPRAAVLPKSKPRPKPIPKKTRAKSPTPPPEDDGFISDVEMDDAAIDTSTYNPDPSQASETTDTRMDGSELSETPTSPPKKKARIDKREGKKVPAEKTKVRDAIKAAQLEEANEQETRKKRKTAQPPSTISIDSDTESDVLAIDAMPTAAHSKRSALQQADHSDDEPMLTDIPAKPQWAMPALSNENPPKTRPRGSQTEERGSRKVMEKAKVKVTEKAKEKEKSDDKGKGKQQRDKKSVQPKSDSASAMGSKEFSTGINDWAASIPENSKPGSKANTSQPSIFKNRSASRRNGSVLPPLTNGSTRSSSNSVLTNNVLISHAESVIRIKEEPKKNYHLGVIDGGLSDEDETQGLEREAAVASPPKGKKRVTSSALVKDSPVKPIARQTERAKKPSNDDLPEGIDPKIWRRVFISTYIQYVATLANPWEVPAKLACEKMQVIWDAIFPHIGHTVTSLSSVYYIAVQRVADSYRSNIGSAAIAIVIAYFESQDSLRDSDDNCAEFAVFALSNLRFLYKKANGDDKSKFRGLYQGAFVVQTFGAHFTATRGAQKIPGVDKPGVLANPAGGLALSCAAVERALTLWSTRTLTIKMVQAAKNKTSISLPKTMNQSTGKVSCRQTGFNDISWGTSTRAYAKAIMKNLREDKFEVIIASAMEFSKKSRRPGDDVDDAAVEDDLDLDERAQLVDISDTESEGNDGSDLDVE